MKVVGATFMPSELSFWGYNEQEGSHNWDNFLHLLEIVIEENLGLQPKLKS